MIHAKKRQKKKADLSRGKLDLLILPALRLTAAYRFAPGKRRLDETWKARKPFSGAPEKELRC